MNNELIDLSLDPDLGYMEKINFITKNKGKFKRKFKNQKIFFLSDTNLQFLIDEGKWWGYQFKFNLEPYSLGFGSLETQVIKLNNYDVKTEYSVILAFTLQDLLGSDFDNNFVNHNIVKKLIKRLNQILIMLNSNDRVNEIFIIDYGIKNDHNYTNINSEDTIISTNELLSYVFKKLNKKHNNLFLSTKQSFSRKIDNDFYNETKFNKFKLIAHKYEYLFLCQIYGNLYNKTFGSKKCIIVDLDNTLWKGIIGEDGISKITYKNKNSRLHFQFAKFLKSLINIGVFICISSKNNLSTVKDFFKREENYPLKFSDFTLFEINWNDKSESIKKISKDLNINLDSIVFIDDSDFEINFIRKKYPEIFSIKFVYNETYFFKLISVLSSIFIDKKITNESIERNKNLKKISYELNKEKYSSQSKESFLKSLNSKLDFKKYNSNTKTRILELLNKTNQFNNNGFRYNEKKLDQIAKKEKVIAILMNDKFQNYGIIGVLIVNIDFTKKIFIKAYCQSCRILGRNIEKEIFEKLFEKYNFNEIVIDYKNTRRNIVFFKTINSLTHENINNNFKISLNYV